jgi:hypothetical protein
MQTKSVVNYVMQALNCAKNTWHNEMSKALSNENKCRQNEELSIKNTAGMIREKHVERMCKKCRLG